MLGKKRFKKEKKQNMESKNIIELNNKYQRIEIGKENNFKKRLNKKTREEKKNNNNFFSENDNIQNETQKYNLKNNYEQIKQKFKQLDNNFGENNISIINNIDRLTSVLSSIIIAKNEQKTLKETKETEINYKNKEKGRETIEKEKNYNDKENSEDIKPLIIDANKDKYLNYLLSLNDSLKKKINNSIKFDEIDNFFTSFTFEKIENFMNNLKKK